VAKRLVSELVGVCKGMICDGEVTEGETLTLKRWLAGHPDATIRYPSSVLAERLTRIYSDGVITQEERSELEDLLLDLAGETEEHDQPLNLSTRLPFDHPAPTILFDDFEYVFTGRLLYGTRRACEQSVLQPGGRAGAAVTQRSNYLVIGPIASRAWLESTFGCKIQYAVELRSSGHPVRIVSEESWVQAIAPVAG
jgi:NAD-dependent DNA ligase